MRKIAKESNKVMSPAEQLLANAQLLVDIERKQKETESRISKTEQAVLMLEARTQTRSNYFTFAGYATLYKMNCGLKLASSLGKKASALCNQRNIPTESLPDPRFGIVKTYPVTILKEVFSMNIV
jgi:anti-repressor protein